MFNSYVPLQQTALHIQVGTNYIAVDEYNTKQIRITIADVKITFIREFKPHCHSYKISMCYWTCIKWQIFNAHEFKLYVLTQCSVGVKSTQIPKKFKCFVMLK